MAIAGFLIAVAITGYILIGYPLLLRFLTWPEQPKVRKDPEYRTTVSVILAVYNGAAFLRSKLDSILSLEYPRELLQILVVSDGSTDASEAIVREYSHRGVELVVCPHAGKAASLNAAFPLARGEILFLTDVRQILNADVVRQLVANFADPTVGAVSGEMRLFAGDSGEQEDMGLYWRYELWARQRHSRIDSLFNTTGCVYALRRQFSTPPLPADTLSDDAVLPLRAFFAGQRVIFDPSAIAFDYPAVAGTEFRRRWRNLAGLWQVHARTRGLFSSANRMRLHFLSHKFARLVLPWSLLATFGFTLLLPAGWFRNLMLLAEGGFAGLAVLDQWMPAGFPLKRMSSPVRTFLLMNVASMAALTVFLLPPQRLWKPTRAADIRPQG